MTALNGGDFLLAVFGLFTLVGGIAQLIRNGSLGTTDEFWPEIILAFVLMLAGITLIIQAYYNTAGGC